MHLYIWVETKEDGKEHMCSSNTAPNKPDYMSFEIKGKDKSYILTSIEHRHNVAHASSNLTHVDLTSVSKDILFGIVQIIISKYYAKFPNISISDGGKIDYDVCGDFNDPSYFKGGITPKEVLLEKIKFLFGFNNVAIANYTILGINKVAGCIGYLMYEKYGVYNLFVLSNKYGDVVIYPFVFPKHIYKNVRKKIITIMDESIERYSFNYQQKKECLKDLDSYFNGDSKEEKLIRLDNNIISEIINEDGNGKLLSHVVQRSNRYKLGDYAELIKNLDAYTIYSLNKMIAYFGFKLTENTYYNYNLLPLVNHYQTY